MLSINEHSTYPCSDNGMLTALILVAGLRISQRHRMLAMKVRASLQRGVSHQ